MGRVLARASTAMEIDGAREFELTRKDFKFIQWFIHKNVGIHLTDQKYAMVYGRLSRKLREKGLVRFVDYRELIEHSEQDKMEFINALTTNKTAFFREQHHFDYLEEKLLPKWKAEGRKEIRIWSAGCSTGEEPYSYLASLSHKGAFDNFERVSLLATDLDTNVLAHAKEAIYDEESLPSIPNRYLKKNFVKGKGEFQGKFKCANRLREHVTFNQLNLLGDWPMKKKFDLISCRNVMIYFDKETQKKLIDRFHHQLVDDGTLFIGHSEGVGSDCQIFRHLGNTIYHRL
ncbi:protein-glutamate O-methyltransferase CheR [Vibrio sp. T187]|uniref:CheR family methyltransferase n=1 Tax=Vibrio TaxID=662 RepID=UPI0010C9D4D1|nr:MULTISPECIES: protein-glutamate O-methyltransferase CheR [Vibrio]MBW3695247.1 protein-glutamate O-methyltransferase CheR [Vibrio sp. T187]